MQFFLILLRFLISNFPGCIKVLEPARVRHEDSNKPGKAKLAVYVPFWGWLEIDAEFLTNPWSYHQSTSVDHDKSPPQDPPERYRT